MKYNPERHDRHSIRLRSHNYAGIGAYFVTVCCQNRMHYFGEIENEKMIFNDYGNIAYNEWKKLSERYLETKFDIFQIMPDHIHGIIEINVGATLAVAQFHNDAQTHDGTTANANTNANGATARVAPTIGRIIGAYKSLVFTKCLEISNQNKCGLGKLWQRNYYERIIRDKAEYARIAKYIRNNPILWGKNP
ncbi:MAG: hypothetical protein LBC64_01765 [Fibromonadaceae bacterium]|jgi:REP element-mobilizing transposase RayT|nr:hypothetical protein [Fibromonadaceae bacterium]